MDYEKFANKGEADMLTEPIYDEFSLKSFMLLNGKDH